MRMKWFSTGIVLAGLVLAGAGCGFGDRLSMWFSASTSTGSFAGLTPAEIAQRIQFIPGDTLEIHQTLLGLGAFLPDLVDPSNSGREVTITRFAPMNIGGLSWKFTTTRTREEAIKVDSLEQTLTAPGTPEAPKTKTVTEEVVVSGDVTNINLKESHSASLPAYWKEGALDLNNERSGIWLSDDAYLELSKTNQTPLNLGVFDEAVSNVTKNVAELKAALGKLRDQANQDDARGDLTLLKADPERVHVTIKVNGEDVTVQAIRARNWFGEITVMDSRQNPLILSVTINPLFAGAREFLGGGLDSLDELFGYEVTSITLKR